VGSSNHRTRVLLCSRLGRQAERLHCSHCCPYLQPAERTGKVRPDRRATNVRSSNRTNEIARKLPQCEAVVGSSNHRTRVLLCSRLRRQADWLHCAHRRAYLQPAERTVEAWLHRLSTNVWSSNRTNEILRKTAAHKARPSWGRAIIVLVCSCAHDCDAKLSGCTAATAARTSSRLSGQGRRGCTGVRPTCGRAIAPTRSCAKLTHTRRGRRGVEQSSYLCALVLTTATPS
jgi:hypothetical protein